MIYELNYNLITIVDLISLIQGLVLGFLLIFLSNKERPTLLLGVFILSFSIEVLDVLLGETGIIEQYPSLLFLPLNFYFLTIPLLYLYTKNLINKISIKESVIVLLPGIVEFLIVFILFLFPATEKLRLIDTMFIRIITEIYDYISIVFSIFFAVLIIKLIKKHKINVGNYYSDLKWKNLNWINYITYYILVQFTLIFIFSFFPKYDSTFSFICAVLNLVVIYWVGISGLYQIKVNGNSEGFDNEPYDDKGVVLQATNESMKNDEIYSNLLAFIEDMKPYKVHDLTLDTLSKQSGITKRVLSQIINKNAKTNFNMFINEFRVKEAKRLLSSEEYNQYSIQGIAFEAGFKSKATFYAVFKKIVGTTPNAYKLHSKKL